MTSPANVLERPTQVVDQRTPLPSGGLPPQGAAAKPAETSNRRFPEPPAPAENSNATANPGILGSSLQRLYDSTGPAGTAPVFSSQSSQKNVFGPTADLTESLLESVFEISEFDPLPHLSYRDEDFGFGLLTESPRYSPLAKSSPSKSGTTHTAPGIVQSPASASPDGLSGLDRRRLPRRESDCVVSVCRCRDDERLTVERVSWLLHATKLKGQLVDVSMSGMAFHLLESLAAGSKILLRISNRTLDKQVDVMAKVLRSRAARDGGWDVVCRFTKNLTFEQIHTVGRSLFAATIV